MKLYRRKSIRLKGYDYAQDGLYFVTICTKNRRCLFGDIVDDKMQLNKVGQMVDHYWKEIPHHFENVILDQYIIMPNHIHGIIGIVQNSSRGLIHQTPKTPIDQIQNFTMHTKQSKKGVINHAPTTWGLMKNPKMTLGKIIRHFKAKCTRAIHCQFHKDFQWQRDYHDHVIRNKYELIDIKSYIKNNPLKWHLDKVDQSE